MDNVRIALCFSGQIRTGLLTSENLKRYIGNLYDNCDIFVHTWNVRTDMHTGEITAIEDESVFEKFKEIYNPKKMIVEDFLQYKKSMHPIFHTFLKCDDLRLEYENENNVTYDFVIKIRPDMLISPRFVLIDEITKIMELDYENTIYTMDVISIIKKDVFEDIFWISIPRLFESVREYCYLRDGILPNDVSWQVQMPGFFKEKGVKYDSLPINNEAILYQWNNVKYKRSVEVIDKEWLGEDSYHDVRVKYFLFYNMLKYAYIETTNYCNLDCSFCNRKSVIGNLQHMPLYRFVEILDKIAGAPLEDIKLMGMGEPFFHPEYDKICKVSKEMFPKSKLISSTNCQYKINKIFRDSLQYIDVLYLSIDGYKETYELNRKGSSWNRLIEFLEELKSVNRHNCKIVINYVVNPNNVQDIQKVYDEILIKYNLEELRLNIAQNWSEDEHIVSGYSDEQIQYLRDNWKENVKGDPNWDYNKCFWPHNGFYVTVNGGMKICCLNTEVKSVGNLFKDQINRIRYYKKFRSVRVGCQTNNPTDHCKTCSYKELVPILKRIKND